MEEETYLIGFMEDGVYFVTASLQVPDAEAAERQLGNDWRAVAHVFLHPTGVDEDWEVCESDATDACPGWRLVDTSMPEILEDGEWHPNPYYDRERSRGRRILGQN
jgi:hypothetical protein